MYNFTSPVREYLEHECCGCSCEVCDSGHRGGFHTLLCIERMEALFAQYELNSPSDIEQ